MTAKTLTDVEAAIRVTRNLVIENDATNPNFQLDITADALSVEDMLFTSLSLGADITASGANGLDTGTEASSTWYAVWVIAKPDGTVAALLSASFTAPTMPSGYTKKRRVGAVRNNGSSNFYRILQIGDLVTYLEPTHDSSNHEVLNAGTATTFTTVTGSNRTIPPTSRRGWYLVAVPLGTAVAVVYARPSGSGLSAGRVVGRGANASSVSGAMYIMGYIDLDSSQSFDYRMDTEPSPGAYISVFGYIDPVL